MAEFKWAVVIGRFQPLHNAHVKIIQHALKVAEHVIIIIGSHRATQTVKNPFTSKECEQMIAAQFSNDLGRISFCMVRDHLYNDNLWIVDVQLAVNTITKGDTDICIVGHNSDDSSWYLASFPHWKQKLIGSQGNYHATDVRRALFEGESYSNIVPTATAAFLEDFKRRDEYRSLLDEYKFLKKYKADWESAPYPPTFVTCDAVVVKSGHILLVKRRVMPGKGLYALAGGFVNQRETIAQATIREVHEEVGLWLPPESLKETRVFDHPDRSLRGRTITHATLFDLGIGLLPPLKGGDDAESAHWVTLNDVFQNEDKFFEDHVSIIETLVYRQ